MVRVTRGADTVIEVSLDAMLRRLRDQPGSQRGRTIAASLLTAEAGNRRAKAVVYLRELSGLVTGPGVRITEAQGEVLLRRLE